MMDSQTATPVAQNLDRQDARTRLSHVLASDPEPESDSSLQQQSASNPYSAKSRPPLPASSLTNTMPRVKQEPRHQVDTDDGVPPPPPPGGVTMKSDVPMYTATTTSTRRNANGSVSSVYSGNKIRHLKKEDGVPLWRSDIQFDFLKAVFDNPEQVFHRMSDGPGGEAKYNFADIYLDAMANSSKCSKILKDKLLTERPAALNMAMVCLLVNVGRMNTTLNFFPEMRAQLRTYHSIPSLQAHQDPNAYKQLQDAPRLKSILKGATEDIEQPSTLEDVQRAKIPRTNPVNLIFVLAQYAPKISEVHFDVPRDFFDLVMKPNLSSASRATAFLWLMWWYLESDFSDDDAMRNPFGQGRRSKPDERPLKTPQFEYLTDEQAAVENQDTADEIEFGEIKKQERIAILKTDMAPIVTGPKRSGKRAGYNQNPVFQVASDDGIGSPSRDPNSPAPPPPPRGGYRSKPLQTSTFVNKTADYPSDTDRTRSASPPVPGTGAFHSKPGLSSMRITTMLNDDGPTAPPAKTSGRGRGNWRRNRDGGHHNPRSHAAKLEAANEAGSPASSTAAPTHGGPHGYYLPLNGSEPVHKRSRPLTSHQLAVERYRKARVDHILDRGWRSSQALSRKQRGKDGSATIRAWKRCRALPSGYDSEEELALRQQSVAGLEAAEGLMLLAGIRRAGWEDDDWGDEAEALASGLRRARRRRERWERGEQVVRKPRTPAGPTSGPRGPRLDDLLHENDDVDVASSPPAEPDMDEDDGPDPQGQPEADDGDGDGDEELDDAENGDVDEEGDDVMDDGDDEDEPMVDADVGEDQAVLA